MVTPNFFVLIRKHVYTEEAQMQFVKWLYNLLTILKYCGVTKGTGQYPAVNGTDDVDLIS